jgi:hypothetical protein
MKQKTDKERRALVEEWKSSFETMAGFCRRKGISTESLKRWKRRVGVGVPPSFLPVAVVGAMPVATDEEPCRILVGGRFIVECRERSSERIVEKALRAAVAACGPISVR